MQIEWRVSGEELNLTVFADDFEDDCVNLSLKTLDKLRLNRMIEQGDMYHSLQFRLTEFVLFKVDRGLLPDIHRLSVRTIRAAGGKNICRIPDMGLDLDTVQRLENRKGNGPWHITWDLLSDFKKPIDITGDLKLYDFVKRLITEDYVSSFASGTGAIPASPAVGKSNAAPGRNITVAYKLNLFKLHPKFGPLGDLTPDVSRVLGWLCTDDKGKQDQDRICDVLRTGVIAAIETVCRQLAIVLDQLPPQRPPSIAWGRKLREGERDRPPSLA